MKLLTHRLQKKKENPQTKTQPEYIVGLITGNCLRTPLTLLIYIGSKQIFQCLNH